MYPEGGPIYHCKLFIVNTCILEWGSDHWKVMGVPEGGPIYHCKLFIVNTCILEWGSDHCKVMGVSRGGTNLSL